MTEQELKSIAGGFIAGNSITSVVSSNLARMAEESRQQLEESKARIAEMKKNCPSKETIAATITEYTLKQNIDAATEYLDNTLVNELLYWARTTKESCITPEEMVANGKEKYLPFYEQIGREMPTTIAELTADKLFDLLGIKKYTVLTQAEWDAKMEKMNKEISENNSGCLGVLACILLFSSILTIACNCI